MSQWPTRPRKRPQGRRIVRAGPDAVRRLPVTASSPKILPQPSLAPRSRGEALSGTVVLTATLLLLLALISFSIARFEMVGLTGRFFVGTIIVLTSIAAALYIIGLGLYVLPVLFGVRKPEPVPPPTWPGIGDRH